MIKKTTAIFVIFITSITLLAHAVVPHLHFNETLVFTKCNIEKENHHHQKSDEDHNNPDYCILKKILFARVNNNGLNYRNLVFVDHDNSINGLHAASATISGWHSYNPSDQQVFSLGKVELLPTQFLPGETESRAPPTV